MTKTQDTRYKQDTNSNTQKFLNIGYCVLFVSCFLYLVSSAPAVAQTDLSFGHTLRSPDQKMSVTVAPNTLTRQVFTELQSAADYPQLPRDKVLAGQVYFYALLPATDNRLESPVTLTASYDPAETRYKEIFVYDELTATWRHLAGDINSDNNTLSAQTLRASGYAAVLADKIEKSEYLKEELNSPTLLVADAKTGEVLLERESAVKRPIASLTKLMTAAVFLDNNPGWGKLVTMQKSDDTIPAKIYVKVGDKISNRDLFFAALVHSANNAAKALARSTGLTSAEFIRRMNAKARQLGMANTRFVEPTGLSAGNVSTAEDYLKLAQTLLKDKLFLEATTLKNYRLTVKRGKKTIKLTTANSNKILNSPYIITGSKTGYTEEAGRCLMIRAKNQAGREVIAIIMGATVPGRQWSDMNSLLAAALGGNNITLATKQ